MVHLAISELHAVSNDAATSAGGRLARLGRSRHLA
jgi:hypothetical protein